MQYNQTLRLYKCTTKLKHVHRDFTTPIGIIQVFQISNTDLMKEISKVTFKTQLKL